MATNGAKAFIADSTRGKGEANGLTVPTPQQRAEYEFNLGQHIFKPSVIGVDEAGNIHYTSQNRHSEGQVMQVSPTEYGSMVTTNLQKKG